jgi:hypothetical protein
MIRMLALVTLTALPIALRSTTPSSFLDRVRGVWSGSGTLAGRPMDAIYRWSNGSPGSTMTVALRLPGTETAVFTGALQPPGETAAGRWTDSQGADYRVDLVALSHDSLVTGWGPDSSRGRSVYRLHGADSLEVRDYRVNASTGATSLFGRYLTRRQ